MFKWKKSLDANEDSAPEVDQARRKVKFYFFQALSESMGSDFGILTIIHDLMRLAAQKKASGVTACSVHAATALDMVRN